MIARALLLATALFAAPGAAVAQAQESLTNRDVIAAPALRANVQVSGDLVRIGDLIDNAGSTAQIPVYRSPDLGTTGVLQVAQVLTVLRAKQVIGVMTGDIKEVSVTRLARTLANKDLELAVASALERRFGLGDAANITVTFDRGVSDVRLDASNTGALQAAATRYDARSGRFDLTFEINNENSPTPTKLRLTGTAIETVEVAVLTRDIDRTEILKSSDVALERRPKAEISGEAASRERAVGMQLRHPMRAGQPIRVADIAKPESCSATRTSPSSTRCLAFTSPPAARRSTTAPRVTPSPFSTCSPSARCRASSPAAARSRSWVPASPRPQPPRSSRRHPGATRRPRPSHSPRA